MRNVRQLTVKQFRIYPADIIPVELFLGARGLRPLVEELGFRDLRADEQTGEVVLVAGLVGSGDGEDEGIQITELRLGERRVALEVYGSSANCTAAFSRVAEILSEADPLRRLENNKPVLLTQETACSVDLDFPWQKLFNPALVEFLERDSSQFLDADQVHARLKQLGLRFAFSFETRDDDLQDLVTFFDKQLALEPRVGVPLNARRYFTQSPVDSDTHFRLLEELETKLART